MKTKKTPGEQTRKSEHKNSTRIEDLRKIAELVHEWCSSKEIAQGLADILTGEKRFLDPSGSAATYESLDDLPNNSTPLFDRLFSSNLQKKIGNLDMALSAEIRSGGIDIPPSDLKAHRKLSELIDELDEFSEAEEISYFHSRHAIEPLEQMPLFNESCDDILDKRHLPLLRIPVGFTAESYSSINTLLQSITYARSSDEKGDDSIIVPITFIIPTCSSIQSPVKKPTEQMEIMCPANWDHYEIDVQTDSMPTLCTRLFCVLEILKLHKSVTKSPEESIERHSLFRKFTEIMESSLDYDEHNLFAELSVKAQQFDYEEVKLREVKQKEVKQKREREVEPETAYVKKNGREKIDSDTNIWSWSLEAPYTYFSFKVNTSFKSSTSTSELNEFAYVRVETNQQKQNVSLKDAEALIHPLSFVFSVSSGTAITLYVPSNPSCELKTPQLIIPKGMKSLVSKIKRLQENLDELINDNEKDTAEKFTKAFGNSVPGSGDGKVMSRDAPDLLARAVVSQYANDFHGDTVMWLKWFDGMFEPLIPYACPYKNLIAPTDLKSV